MQLRCLTLLFVVFSLSAVPAHCRAEHYGDFHRVQYLRNYDGDTITVNIPGTHPLLGKSISVRLDGIDTPEIKGKCPKERALAKRAKVLVRNRLQNAREITLKNVGRGKYFRVTATVVADGVDLQHELIAAGLAVKYDGGRKVKKWCE